MAVRDLRSQRLYLDAPLQAGSEIALTSEQAHYLANVLRAKAGMELLVFNGRDGEWLAGLAEVSRKSGTLRVVSQTRAQTDGPDVTYMFAPLKRARLDYLVQKATELGVRRIVPVLTAHTVADRVNLDRMRANVIEAAEQCGVLRLPELVAPQKLNAALDAWPASAPLIFCDEAAAVSDPVTTLSAVPRAPIAVLIGPEGGFSANERADILARENVTAVSLGPRVMRADTAAVAILSLVNATLGDWRAF
ncbi:MAG: 16S rRNA (uracil(1498)-N(3))-methyltransferase [Pseudomonadota bacterium]